MRNPVAESALRVPVLTAEAAARVLATGEPFDTLWINRITGQLADSGRLEPDASGRVIFTDDKTGRATALDVGWDTFGRRAFGCPGCARPRGRLYVTSEGPRCLECAGLRKATAADLRRDLDVRARLLEFLRSVANSEPAAPEPRALPGPRP